MDVRFHCTKRVRHSGKKSKHGVMETCHTLQQVLRLNPHFGVSIPRFHELRKMRLQVPGLNAGKRGGYRLIYRAKEMDEALGLAWLICGWWCWTATESSGRFSRHANVTTG
ncbi:MAG: hypothetical protein WCO57_10420 [Verrucomicrobiota bacterium]